MRTNTTELTGAALDWAVAKCEGHDTRNNACIWFLPFQAESDDLLQFICMADDYEHAREQCEDAYPDCTIDRVEHINRFKPSSDWSQGGPIIEREKIEVIFEGDCWIAMKYGTDDNSNEITEDYPYGLTALIAGMRCYVASKLGDEVDVPDELINN